MRVMRIDQKGFTLVEILTVIAVSLIVLGVFYKVFVSNWFAYEETIVRAQLWYEAHDIVEHLTIDARSADTITVTANDSGDQTVVMLDDLDEVIATYTMTDDGALEMDRAVNTGVVILTDNVNTDESEFTNQNIGRALGLELTLQERVFFRNVTVSTTAEIFPRN